jgi:hypothetical protein
VKPYNVIAYFYGHSGAGLRQFKPEGEDKPLDCVNAGQMEKGFFVVEVTAKRLRLACHIKEGAKAGAVEWEWEFLFGKPITQGK